MIVKGISHFSDDSNTSDESWKSFASVMAASLVLVQCELQDFKERTVK